MSIELKFKKLHPDAVTPKYATAGAACFDLVAVDYGVVHPVDPNATIYRTGLSFEVPEGFALMIYSRSGQGFNQAARLSNCVGVIDSDYRGEVKVALRCDGQDLICWEKGDRIAQAMIVPIPAVELIEADELTETQRGTGGFGSTGK